MYAENTQTARPDAVAKGRVGAPSPSISRLFTRPAWIVPAISALVAAVAADFLPYLNRMFRIIVLLLEN